MDQERVSNLPHLGIFARELGALVIVVKLAVEAVFEGLND